MPWILALFITMPIIEIAVLLRVGSIIGWFPTLAIVILTAVLGTAMLRQQGMATLNRARKRLDDGEMPAQQLLEGMILLVGGALLLTPGFVTDAFGFACLIPGTRARMAEWLSRRSLSAVHVEVNGQRVGQGSAGDRPGGSTRGTNRGPFGQTGSGSRQPGRAESGEIIEGDFERKE